MSTVSISPVDRKVETTVIPKQSGNIFAWIGKRWCQQFHKSISIPVHSQYQCWKCGRVFHTTFE
jgi:hypothetical protein